MNKVIFGNYVRKCRKKKGYTQQYLADLLSVNINSIGNIETGKNYPDCDKLFSLIQILDMSIDTLVFNETHMGESLLPDELNKKIASLNSNDKAIVFDTLDFLVNKLLNRPDL